jgi:hypothetical protein
VAKDLTKESFILATLQKNVAGDVWIIRESRTEVELKFLHAIFVFIELRNREFRDTAMSRNCVQMERGNDVKPEPAFEFANGEPNDEIRTRFSTAVGNEFGRCKVRPFEKNREPVSVLCFDVECKTDERRREIDALDTAGYRKGWLRRASRRAGCRR